MCVKEVFFVPRLGFQLIPRRGDMNPSPAYLGQPLKVPSPDSFLSTLLVASLAVQKTFNLIELYGNEYGDFSKLKIEVLFESDLPLLGIFSKLLKTSYYSDPCTAMFIEAQFIMANLGSSLRVHQKMN